MGLTVHQTPLAYTPGFNQQIFQATSTNSAVSDHRYVVIITDVITGDSVTYDVNAEPEFQSCVFNAYEFVKAYMVHFVPLNGATGWQVVTGGIRKFTVNVGEYYSGSYHGGSNFNYFAWNGIVDYADFPLFVVNQYVYNSVLQNTKYFAGVLQDTSFTDRSNWLYVLNNIAGTIQQIQIDTYSKAGTFIATSLIANPYNATADYKEGYLCIDVGIRGLTNISGGSVVGAYPIITANVASYKIYDNQLIPFNGVTCNLPAAVLDMNFTIDPGLLAGQVFDYVLNSPGTTGSPANGTATITTVNGGGNYTTTISCSISVGSVAGGTILIYGTRLIKEIKVGCENQYDQLVTHYLARNGGFQTAFFNMINERTVNKEGLTYMQDPNVNSGTTFGYSPHDAVEIDLNTTKQDAILMRTDWLTADQVVKYEDLFASQKIYLDEGSGSQWQRIRQTTAQYLKLPFYKKKLHQLEQTFLKAHKNYSQDV